MNKKNLIVIAAFIYLFANLVNLITQEFRLQKYQGMLEQDLQVARKEHESLKGAIKRYDTRQGVEELARNRLGYYQGNEIPVRVIESNPSQAVDTHQSAH
jgi:cell division protein FtsB